FNKSVAQKARTAALNLAKSTTDTTTKALNDALDQTREALGSGLEAGESIRELTERIKDIFENAADERAQLIATTEASRAHHEGLRVSAKDSGVVSGFEWITSSDPCPECQELNGKRFDIDGEMPPLHPKCMCAVLEVLDITEEDEEGDE
ncbi:MAG: minor capsid protein, partial [Microthrixaceae bacterium]|nr:minor capsid protein [Microthrixaceae bacterium]